MTAGLLALMLVLGQSPPDGHDHGAEDAHGDAAIDSAGFGADRHLHPPGEENHGTEWFFSQPWATPERWRFMARDSVVLASAAAGILMLSGLRRRK
ncbi:MAG: hypothetical protein QUS11_02380 [Candidatus Fermentibacter sp.]|nr:hypothetical protein [Candidatus Fermentibacter sp.]